MIREIVTDREFLAQPCKSIDGEEPEEIMDVIMDLIETAKHANVNIPGGCAGLAANQIGHQYRIFVIQHEGHFKAIVDPEIVRTWGGKEGKGEGCLSVPGSVETPIKVVRHRRIRIKFFDLKTKNWIKRNFSGFKARVLQHEMDHLDGVTIGDE